MSINSAGGRAALNRRERGIALAELVIAIVVISVALAGALTVFINVVIHSATPVIQKQMLAIAEEMMEEIVLKTYTGAAVTPVGCVRSIYNNIGNYNGYATNNYICDADGNQIAPLAGYSVSVAVTPDAVTFSGVGVTAASKIVVTVTHGSQSISLAGWRTNYAS